MIALGVGEPLCPLNTHAAGSQKRLPMLPHPETNQGLGEHVKPPPAPLSVACFLQGGGRVEVGRRKLCVLLPPPGQSGHP